MQHQRLLDDIGWRILRALQSNARLSFSELGRRVGLSTPAVTERVKRMEEAGILTGYHAAVEPSAVGLSVLAFVRVNVTGDERTAQRLAASAREMDEVLECHRCTGDHAFILKVAVASVSHLERLIDRLTPFGMTSTSLVLSSPVKRANLENPEVSERI
jgi:Lrp/AsnC family leucine-responsive transcriptional regulator